MGLSLGHILILSIVLLLFGSKRLPQLASALGKSVGAFREGLKGSEAQVEHDDFSSEKRNS